MKVFIGVLCLVLVSLAQAGLDLDGVKDALEKKLKAIEKVKLNSIYRATLDAADLKCISKTSIDQDGLKKARNDGHLADTADVRKFVNCLGKRFDVIDVDANILKTDVISRTLVNDYLLDQERTDYIIQICAVIKDNAENTLFDFYNCALSLKFIEY